MLPLLEVSLTSQAGAAVVVMSLFSCSNSERESLLHSEKIAKIYNANKNTLDVDGVF